MDIDILTQYGGRYLEGLWVTVQLLVLASLCGLTIAVPLALARVSSNVFLSSIAYVYIYVFRGTPLLIQLFLIYFGLAQFESVRDSFLWPVLRNEYWAGLITLALNTSAYVAEILRGGIRGVPHGDIEAGRAAGMSPALLYRRLILPKAFRIAWPAYGNEVVLLLKGSALVSTITVLDLMGETRTIFSRNYSLDTFLYAGILYLLITFILTRGFRMGERHLNRHLQTPGMA
jgi:polar amino acid transport system permease protein